MAQQEWLVQLVVRASREELDALTDRMGEVVCSPADHEGPCATPWTMVTVPLADLPKQAQAKWRSLLEDK